jgi:hypothetical protein
MDKDGYKLVQGPVVPPYDPFGRNVLHAVVRILTNERVNNAEALPTVVGGSIPPLNGTCAQYGPAVIRYHAFCCTTVNTGKEERMC